MEAAELQQRPMRPFSMPAFLGFMASMGVPAAIAVVGVIVEGFGASSSRS